MGHPQRSVITRALGPEGTVEVDTRSFRARAADTYQVLHTYPHDSQAFTQGLIYLDGHLYESTGIKGHSSLRMEDLETGRILQFQDVPDKYFAEGLAAWKSGSNDTLIQLTWQDHIALVYDRWGRIVRDATGAGAWIQ